VLFGQAAKHFSRYERLPPLNSAFEVLFMLCEWQAAKSRQHREFVSSKMLCLVLLRVSWEKSPITVPNASCQDLHIEGLSER
jgi:hypothetical protein